MIHQKLIHYSANRDNDGVYRIVLDVSGRAMNIFNHAVMTELDLIITDLEGRTDIRLVIFKSGKESGFLAGADVGAIQGIASAEEAERLLLHGQRLFSRIERLSVPTLAMLHGPCLGGGLELALACDYRIARDNSSTKIGLPEINLGLIPGWGGTQRLPKRVGIHQSLTMILSGKHLSASEAYKVGLIDQAIRPDDWRDEVAKVIQQLASGRSLSRTFPNRNRMMQVIQRFSIVRNFLLAVTKRRLSRKSRHYPAINAALEAIADSFSDAVDGFTTERRKFSRLIFTPTCRHLMGVFVAREQARDAKTWTAEAVDVIHRDPIRKIGVIGAGAMGAGIAFQAATRGFEVGVKEINAESVNNGVRRIDDLASKYAHHKRWDRRQRDQLCQRIQITADLKSIADADCVVEAVVERMDVKKSVLGEVERSVGISTILATNTSALSVSEMSESLDRPSRFAGLHFFNPVHRMELVEVVRGKATSDSTIASLVTLVRALGKTPIVTTDSPGFLVNRILFPYLGEAVLMVRQGYDVATIDREIRHFGMPMGPLELLDRVGLDVALHVAESLRTTLCDVDDVIELLSPLVDRNQCGLKSGFGFYDYSRRRKQPRMISELVDYLVPISESPGFLVDDLSDIQRRLLYPMLSEAIRCDDESNVDHAWAIDLAMVLGTGFAPHRGGPLTMVDEIGAKAIRLNLEQLRSQFGPRFEAPQGLLDHCRTGEPLT